MSARDNLEYEFLKEQLREFKEGQVRLEDKFDLLRADFNDEIKDLRTAIDHKIEPIITKFHEHEKQLAKHSQAFNICTVLLTTGIAGIGGFCAWFWEILTQSKH